MTGREIIDLLRARSSETRNRGNLLKDTHQIESARVEWYVADVLDELIAEIKKRDPNL